MGFTAAVFISPPHNGPERLVWTLDSESLYGTGCRRRLLEGLTTSSAVDETGVAPERTLAELKQEHGLPPRTLGAAPTGEIDEQSPLRNYIRDLVLGYNDGLVSCYAATAGVAGAAFGAHAILVTGIAAATAGALSMATGEYISTKSQAEFYAAERAREEEHLEHWPHLEEQELRESLEAKGIGPPLLEQVVRTLASDKSKFLDYMMRDEFGIGSESERSPWKAAAIVMVAFLLGSVVALLPYAWISTVRDGLAASTVLSLAGLFLAGVVRARASRLPALRAGLEMVFFGVLAGAIAYGVGTVVARFV